MKRRPRIYYFAVRDAGMFAAKHVYAGTFAEIATKCGATVYGPKTKAEMIHDAAWELDEVPESLCAMPDGKPIYETVVNDECRYTFRRPSWFALAVEAAGNDKQYAVPFLTLSGAERFNRSR